MQAQREKKVIQEVLLGIIALAPQVFDVGKTQIEVLDRLISA